MTLRKDKTLGYLYFIDRDHPLASSTGRVYYHRHVVSIHRGEWLRSDEIVHHIDGDKCNNSLDNLEVMSKSSHARRHKPRNGQIVSRECLECGKEFLPPKRGGKYCSPGCHSSSRKLFEVSAEELFKLVWEMPTVRVAKMFGVSDTAVTKRCKKLGVRKPPVGYWAKVNQEGARPGCRNGLENRRAGVTR